MKTLRLLCLTIGSRIDTLHIDEIHILSFIRFVLDLIVEYTYKDRPDLTYQCNEWRDCLVIWRDIWIVLLR